MRRPGYGGAFQGSKRVAIEKRGTQTSFERISFEGTRIGEASFKETPFEEIPFEEIPFEEIPFEERHKFYQIKSGPADKPPDVGIFMLIAIDPIAFDRIWLVMVLHAKMANVFRSEALWIGSLIERRHLNWFPVLISPCVRLSACRFWWERSLEKRFGKRFEPAIEQRKRLVEEDGWGSTSMEVATFSPHVELPWRTLADATSLSFLFHLKTGFRKMKI